MKQFPLKSTLTAALMLALTFTFSCSGGDDGDGGDPNNGGISSPSGVSSSSSKPSSSSGGSSSSAGSGSGVVYGADVPYQGETYKTVKIGSQTWFQRNLNYAVTGSKCGNGSSLSDANTTTCDTYGRLYDWATAMALDASCNNSSSCASQITTPKHKGVCPSGWHIPSNADWNVLMKSVNPSCSDNEDCAGAGTKLKAREGWEPYSGVPAGTDEFGFSALPGSYGNSNGGFHTVGHYGSWWSSSEDNSYLAYHRYMYYNDETVLYHDYLKDYLYSVRCVQD